MPFIEPGTICTHPLIGVCIVKKYDLENRAVVEYYSKRYKTHSIKAHIPARFLEVVNR